MIVLIPEDHRKVFIPGVDLLPFLRDELKMASGPHSRLSVV